MYCTPDRLCDPVGSGWRRVESWGAFAIQLYPAVPADRPHLHHHVHTPGGSRHRRRPGHGHILHHLHRSPARYCEVHTRSYTNALAHAVDVMDSVCVYMCACVCVRSKYDWWALTMPLSFLRLISGCFCASMNHHPHTQHTPTLAQSHSVSHLQHLRERFSLWFIVYLCVHCVHTTVVCMMSLYDWSKAKLQSLLVVINYEWQTGGNAALREGNRQSKNGTEEGRTDRET